MTVEEVDLIVIGSGQGGRPLAVEYAKTGRSVVLFERDRVGGTCGNYGCTPSKTFLASAHAAGRARDAAAIGVHCSIRVDGAAVMRRVNEMRREWLEGAEGRLRDAGVRLVRENASFSGVREVEAGGARYRAQQIVIDAGGRAAIPDIPGLKDTPYLTNASFFDLEDVPESLIVLGAGYIGLELGQGCARLGGSVDIVSPGSLMEREEPDAAAVLREALEADGIRFHLNTRAERVTYENGTFSVQLAGGTALHAGALLVATGRRPNTDGLHAEKSGIELDERGYIKVDEHLRATCPGVFALGDVAGQPAFTHVSWEDYRRVSDVMNGGSRTRSDRPLAYSTFTEPQLARVGMTEGEAKAAGYDAVSVRRDLADEARGIEWNLKRGFFRIVADRATDKILGATFVGYEAGELIHVIYAHIMNGATWHVLDQSVHVHPTFAEGLPTAARLFAGASR